jgi:hypothetical protein
LVRCDCQHVITNTDFSSSIARAAGALELEEIQWYMNRLQEAKLQIRQNANVRLVFEVLMLDMPRKDVQLEGEPVTG